MKKENIIFFLIIITFLFLPKGIQAADIKAVNDFPGLKAAKINLRTDHFPEYNLTPKIKKTTVTQKTTLTQAYFSPSTNIQVSQGSQGTSNFIWPATGTIYQTPNPYHMAVDINNPGLPSIVASMDGSIAFAGCADGGYGCYVIIDHNNGFQTLYAHLSKFTVGMSQTVSKGQEIGIMGDTGYAYGIHLHFEIRTGDNKLNPLDFFSTQKSS